MSQPRITLARACLILFAAATSALAEQPSPVPTSNTTPHASTTKPRIVVSIPPLKGLVESLTREAGIETSGPVEVLIPPGVSEHGYEIPPSRIAALAKADIVLIVGLGLEPQIEKMLADRPRADRSVINAARALGLEPIAPEVALQDKDPGQHAAHDHDHDAQGNCIHNPHADPHLWLDPLLVERLIPIIADALRPSLAHDPAALARLQAAQATTIARVRALHDRYRATLDPAARRTLVVGHDAWRHLADRYHLETVAIKGLTATEPTPESLAAATKAVRDAGVKVIFTEPQLNQSAARRVAAASNTTLATLDPLGDGDWFALMENNLKAIAAALDVPLTPIPSPATPTEKTIPRSNP